MNFFRVALTGFDNFHVIDLFLPAGETQGSESIVEDTTVRVLCRKSVRFLRRTWQRLCCLIKPEEEPDLTPVAATTQDYQLLDLYFNGGHPSHQSSFNYIEHTHTESRFSMDANRIFRQQDHPNGDLKPCREQRGALSDPSLGDGVLGLLTQAHR